MGFYHIVLQIIPGGYKGVSIWVQNMFFASCCAIAKALSLITGPN